MRVAIIKNVDALLNTIVCSLCVRMLFSEENKIPNVALSFGQSMDIIQP